MCERFFKQEKNETDETKDLLAGRVIGENKIRAGIFLVFQEKKFLMTAKFNALKRFKIQRKLQFSKQVQKVAGRNALKSSRCHCPSLKKQ